MGPICNEPPKMWKCLLHPNFGPNWVQFGWGHQFGCNLDGSDLGPIWDFFGWGCPKKLRFGPLPNRNFFGPYQIRTFSWLYWDPLRKSSELGPNWHFFGWGVRKSYDLGPYQIVTFSDHTKSVLFRSFFGYPSKKVPKKFRFGSFLGPIWRPQFEPGCPKLGTI